MKATSVFILAGALAMSGSALHAQGGAQASSSASSSTSVQADKSGAAASNNTSIVTPQPAGGWKANITETEFLCFYDTTSWPLSHRQSGKAVTLPAGCGA